MCVPIDKQWRGFRIMIGRCEKRVALVGVGSVGYCWE